MQPFCTRILPVLGLLAGAPVCAEYLQAYLTSTGEVGTQLAGLLVLGPLYGGAALLIREVAVRTGRGWRGILLLAAAFGTLMPGLIDLSLWTERSADVPYWADMRQATLVEPLGLAVYPLVTWVLGHVLFSIGAPLAMLDALAPRHRGRPLLGRPGVAVVAALFVVAAALIHHDLRSPETLPTAAQAAGVVVAVTVLIVLALSAWGRPSVRQERWAWWTPGRALVGALAAAATFDLLPWSWWGSGALVAVLAVAATTVVRASSGRSWDLRHVTALAVGALVARCLIGFLTPTPPEVDLAAKLTQNAVLLSLTVAVGRLAWRRSRPAVPGPASFMIVDTSSAMAATEVHDHEARPRR